MIGLFADSHGDLAAFDAALKLLRGKGARRFLFAGGRYGDLEEWLVRRRALSRGGREYGEQDFIKDVSQFLGAPSPAQAAGGDDDFEGLAGKISRTPDKDSLAYRDPSVPRKAVDMMGDTLFCMVHDKNDLTRDDLLNATVFIHGKMSEPNVVQIGPRFFITPGALTGAAEQTCALLEKDDRNLRFSAFTLDGRTLIDRQLLAIDRKTKLQVK